MTADLADGLKLTSFVPHPDIKDDEVTGTQALTFNIDISQINEMFFEIDGQPYDPNRIDRTLMLGGVDEWTLKSNFVSHPFHIHVNPFQIVKIIAPDGKTDVSAPGAVDNFAKDPQTGKPIIDPQYPGLKGVWKDTLFVKNAGRPRGPVHGRRAHPLRALHRRLRPALPHPRSRGSGDDAEHPHRPARRPGRRQPRTPLTEDARW